MKRTLLYTVLMLGLFTACVGPFYETDYGRNIALPAGTPFEIRLEGDPHSDFTWKVSDLDTSVVRMVLNPAYRPFNDDSKPGGLYSFYFQTVGNGKTQVEMVYSANDGSTEEPDALKTFLMGIESRI